MSWSWVRPSVTPLHLFRCFCLPGCSTRPTVPCLFEFHRSNQSITVLLVYCIRRSHYRSINWRCPTVLIVLVYCSDGEGLLGLRGCGLEGTRSARQHSEPLIVGYHLLRTFEFRTWSSSTSVRPSQVDNWLSREEKCGKVLGIRMTSMRAAAPIA